MAGDVYAEAETDAVRRRVAEVAGPDARFVPLEYEIHAGEVARYFELGRVFADGAAAELEAAYPGVFDGFFERRADTLFRLFTAIRLSVGELPRLSAFLAGRRPGARAIVVDSFLSEDQVRGLAAALGLEPPEDVLCVSALDERVIERQRRALAAEGDGALELASGRSVVLCGSDLDLPWLEPLVRILARRSGSTVLARNDRPECLRACRALQAAGGSGVVTAQEVDGLASLEETLARAEATLVQIEAREADLGEAGRGTRLRRLVQFLRILRTARKLEAFLRAAEPPLFAGALERTIYPAVVDVVRAGDAPRTVNFQHGTIARFGTGDLLRFDLALVWNETSRRTLLADGYPPELRISVAGNPRWDRLAGLADAAPETPTLVVFPQPVKPPLISAGSMERFFEALAWVLDARPGLRVVVKLRSRPSEIPGLGLLGDRAEVLEDEQLGLEDALRMASAALSISSTALADAAVAGVPAIAVDPDGVLDGLHLDFLSAVTLCRTREELLAAVDRALEAARPADASALHTPGDEPYEQRLERSLSEAGLL